MFHIEHFHAPTLLSTRKKCHKAYHVPNIYAKQSIHSYSNPLPKSTEQTVGLKHMLHHLLLCEDTTKSI